MSDTSFPAAGHERLAQYIAVVRCLAPICSHDGMCVRFVTKRYKLKIEQKKAETRRLC